jgi:hypothetical protein
MYLENNEWDAKAWRWKFLKLIIAAQIFQQQGQIADRDCISLSTAERIVGF